VALVSFLPFYLLPSPSTVLCSFLIVSEILCVSEVTMELEGLRTVVDTFLDYLGVTPGTREDQLWVAHLRALGTKKLLCAR
jgi:hypothetical protein